MGWVKKFVLALPFLIAGILSLLMANADRWHLRNERIAGYGFLFGTPWAWLIDRVMFFHVHNKWLQSMLDYVLVLWIPAALYSACLWLLFFSIVKLRTPREH